MNTFVYKHVLYFFLSFTIFSFKNPTFLLGKSQGSMGGTLRARRSSGGSHGIFGMGSVVVGLIWLLDGF